MKQGYRLFRRGPVFYTCDNLTGQQHSLRARDKADALRLLHARNEAHQQPSINLKIARAYLMAGDPEAARRTWQHVMDEMAKLKASDTRERWLRAVAEKPFDLIRQLAILETRAGHFIQVLSTGTVSTNIFLRRLHNFALDMNWLPASLIPRRQWPRIEFKGKRAITFKEHQKTWRASRIPNGGRTINCSGIWAARRVTLPASRRRTSTGICGWSASAA